LWYLRRGAILTKGNLAKRNWTGTKSIVSVTAMKQLSIECHHVVHLENSSYRYWVNTTMIYVTYARSWLIGEKKERKKDKLTIFVGLNSSLLGYLVLL